MFSYSYQEQLGLYFLPDQFADLQRDDESDPDQKRYREPADRVPGASGYFAVSLEEDEQDENTAPTVLVRRPRSE